MKSSLSLLSFTLSLGLYAVLVGLASGSPTVISDERVRSLDVTPVLGRGYGIQSNTYHSTCLKFPTTTEPTYDYNYFFKDFSSTSDIDKESTLSTDLKTSFGSSWIGASIGFGKSSSNESDKKRTERTVTTTMRIDRYYSSIDEKNAEFSADAKTLLDRADYVGFFKACGPNFIRSLRRAQEVTAKFTFETNDDEEANSMAAYLKAEIKGLWYDAGASVDYLSSETIKKTNSTLQIDIRGWGLGLDIEGSETLVAKSLEEYNDVMKYAYNSMVRGNKGSADTGMVYGMEVVPWVDNAVFQAGIDMPAKQLNKAVNPNLIPDANTNGMCSVGVSDDLNKCCRERDMEERAIPDVTDSTALKSDDGSTDRICETCKACSTTECMDNSVCQVGAICKKIENTIEANQLGCDPNVFNGDVDFEKKYCVPKNPNKTVQVCRPVRPVPLEIMKQNALTNAEFVTVMDSVLRTKMNTAYALERCISSLKGFPPRHDLHFLQTADTVWDSALEMNVTVADLRNALDPDGQLSTVKAVTLEIEEYIQMFYSPCLAALHGANDSGRDGNEITGDPIATDRKLQGHFMTTAYYEHKQCSYVSCLLPNQRWDEALKGCKPGLLVGGARNGGTNDLTDNNESNRYCTKELNPNTLKYECKTSSTTYTELLTDIKRCWGNPNYVPYRLIETFCSPRLSGKTLPQEPLPVKKEPMTDAEEILFNKKLEATKKRNEDKATNICEPSKSSGGAGDASPASADTSSTPPTPTSTTPL